MNSKIKDVETNSFSTNLINVEIRKRKFESYANFYYPTISSSLYKEGNPQFLDIYEHPFDLEESLNASTSGSSRANEGIGYEFIISDCNEYDKLSTRYVQCIGLVLAGTDKETRKELSILTHQEPYLSCISDSSFWFKEDMKTKLGIFLEKCDQNTIDFGMFAGYIRLDEFSLKCYRESVIFMDDFLTKETGLPLKVLSGPNLFTGLENTEVYYETSKRKLNIFRPNQLDGIMEESFCAKRIDEKMKEWKPILDSLP